MQKKINCVLGLNLAYHESSACLFIDGKLQVAIEEERLNRIRHAKPATIESANIIPFAAIDSCLDFVGIHIGDIKAIACSFDPDKRYELNVQYGDAASKEGWGSLTGEAEFKNLLLSIPASLSVHYQTDLASKWHWLSHHLCHLAGAFYQSGFEQAALLCVDGIGEFSTVSFGFANGTELKELGRVQYPNSIGLLWEKLSGFIGFTEYDACKLMSLAAFGDASVFKNKMEQLVYDSDCIFSIDNAIAELRKEDFEHLSEFFNLPARAKGEAFLQRHYDLAAALQQRTNDILLNLVKNVKKLTGSNNLCYSGGVALNCLANQQLCESGLFADIFIQAAANDAGTAVGAAFLLAKEFSVLEPAKPLQQMYLGDEFNSDQIEQALNQAGLAFSREQNIADKTAQLIAEGRIVGWFQGRMEFGPRALGNRSILADPRTMQAKLRLDKHIKFRESFRPYGPSILAEQVTQWFDLPDAARLPAAVMLVAPKVKPECKQRIPAVIHLDNTSRLQTVTQENAPLYYRLIHAFYELTQVPMVLNTSFNSCEPLVHSPEDAINVYLTTDLDALVIGEYLVLAKNQEATDFYTAFCSNEDFRKKVCKNPHEISHAEHSQLIHEYLSRQQQISTNAGDIDSQTTAHAYLRSRW